MQILHFIGHILYFALPEQKQDRILQLESGDVKSAVPMFPDVPPIGKFLPFLEIISR